jgi:hypothetical protein
METPSLSEIIRTSTVVVHEGRYAYLQGQETELKDHFFVSKDADEITIVTEEKNFNHTNFQKDVKWFKLFEIKVAVPFLGVGFLAAITKAIAEKGLDILVVSTFSKDYILVREETYETAVSALKEMGFPIIQKG